MWRAYYDKRYLALFGELYALSRREYGFSPVDSLRLAVSAARAAKTFQPTTSRAAANAALPDLVDYFGILAKGAPGRFDVEAIAGTELDWWQARREHRAAESYGPIVAKVSTLLFGIDNDEVREAGLMRARAMAYRDAHETTMTDAEWTHVREQLDASYRALKAGIAGR
jgi:hypothetical protein